ncbi:MAG: (d)CMP kinase [Abditibacteriota bacterium]|nr:(d)CMP kinase [Abditibacteriota bacterium]
MNYCIAIDGPAGSGKGTVAKRVARRLGFQYVDTGAMYRAVTLYIHRNKIDITNTAAVTAAAQQCDIRFDTPDKDGEQRVYLNGEDVSDEIRSTDITCLVAPVCAIAGVRTCMVERQKEARENYPIVMEGRDIGTVVYPDADLKIFLTATIDERARRRQLQYREKGVEVDLEQLKRDMSQRDMLDSTRERSPLKKAADAITVDSDGMTIEEVTDRIITLFREKVSP